MKHNPEPILRRHISELREADFAKEARDLADAVTRINGGQSIAPRALRLVTVEKLSAPVEALARRMHAAGVAEGLATAAAIADAEIAACRIKEGPYAYQANAIRKVKAGIAEAILTWAPE